GSPCQTVEDHSIRHRQHNFHGLLRNRLVERRSALPTILARGKEEWSERRARYVSAFHSGRSRVSAQELHYRERQRAAKCSVRHVFRLRRASTSPPRGHAETQREMEGAPGET